MIFGITATSAAVSFLLCLVFYLALDLMPTSPSGYLLSYGLPVIAPFLIAPPGLVMLVRLVQRLHDRSTRLEEEVRRRQQAEAKLAILVTTDELTQLANRRAFFARATEISEGTGQDATVAVVDLDDFKNLNDTKGHAAGDAELRRYGTILREFVDINGLAARLGGEEFGLILPHRRAGEAMAFLEELRAKFTAGGEVTASIGVADWPAGQKIDQALASADAALYRAKQRGRNRIEIATPEDAQFGTDLAPVARR